MYSSDRDANDGDAQQTDMAIAEIGTAIAMALAIGARGGAISATYGGVQMCHEPDHMSTLFVSLKSGSAPNSFVLGGAEVPSEESYAAIGLLGAVCFLGQIAAGPRASRNPVHLHLFYSHVLHGYWALCEHKDAAGGGVTDVRALGNGCCNIV